MIEIDCVSAEDLALDAEWWRIYEASLPARERESRAVILGSLGRGVGVAFRARRGQTTVGMATIHLLKRPPAVFLVYLAVADGGRGRGVGGSLLEKAWEHGMERLQAEDLQPVGMVWEVDSPDGGDSTRIAERRIAFFERHRGRVIDSRYLQPPVDGIAPVPMSLMFRAVEGSGEPGRATVEALVRGIYEEKYGAINGIDGSVLSELLAGRTKR